MRTSYVLPELTPRNDEASDAVVEILTERCRTYQEADDVLTLAQAKLIKCTRPVRTDPSIKLTIEER